MRINTNWKTTIETMTTEQRDFATDGENAIIFNTDSGVYEAWNGSEWDSISGGGTVVDPSGVSFLSAVVRIDEGTGEWGLIEDETHEPIGITSVTNYADGAVWNFALNYPQADKVGALIGTVDEYFAKLGYFIGASVQTNVAYFQIWRQGFSGRVIYNGSDFVVETSSGYPVPSSEFSCSWNDTTKTLTVSHPSVSVTADRQPIVTPYTYKYLPIVGNSNGTSFDVQWYDLDNNLENTPFAGLRFHFYIHGAYQVRNSLISDQGNIWINGTMKNEAE